MASSNLLNITQIAESQSNKYQTHNNAVDALEQATNATLENAAVGGSAWAISEAEIVRYYTFKASGASGAFDITVPSTVNSVNAQRVFAVRNEDTTYTATVKASTGSGTSVALAPGASAILMQTHEDVVLVSKSAGTTAPYDIGLFVNGLPVDNDEVMKFVVTRAFSLADDFAGSQGQAGVNPTAAATFTVKHNGATIGTVAISTGGVFTFATSGSGTEDFVAGDRLSVTNPTPQDATLSDVGITFAGTRSV